MCLKELKTKTKTMAMEIVRDVETLKLEENVNIHPTSYRVSTITCNGSLGCNIDLNLLYNHTELSATCQDNHFVWIEFGTERSRGIYPKKRKSGAIRKKSFDNQVTMIYKMRDGYAPNIKVFRNGNIQMTGIRCPEDGMDMIKRIAKEINRIKEKEKEPEIEGSIYTDELKPGDFKIRMINSDFSFDFRIRRKDLHMLLISSKYNTTSSFQPGTYPGVKIQYFWNKNSHHKCGHCECVNPCYGRGTNEITRPVNALENKKQEGGDKEEETTIQCKKVTISVFESGKILITGATSYEQIDEAYAYIVKVIQDNMERIKKNNIPCD